MTFFGELSKRNVFRVGIAYLAGAWLLLQVADRVLSNFAAPAWIIQALIFSSALGFPFVLLLAWFYELTPEGVKATSELDVVEAVKFTGRVGIVPAKLAAMDFKVTLPSRALNDRLWPLTVVQ